MPLVFPTSASIGQTYQSGSSGVFVFNGEAWDSQAASVPIIASTAISASFAITASNATTVTATPTSGSNGNWVDLGQVRYQWGTNTNTSTSLRTVTLPASFRDNTYSVTANVVDQTDSNDRPVAIGIRSTTSFTARPTVNGNGSATPFNWIAIGLKP